MGHRHCCANSDIALLAQINSTFLKIKIDFDVVRADLKVVRVVLWHRASHIERFRDPSVKIIHLALF